MRPPSLGREASSSLSGRGLTLLLHLLRSEGLEAKKNAIIDARSSYDPVESLKPAIDACKAHVRPLPHPRLEPFSSL